jgi:5'-nucleotidase
MASSSSSLARLRIVAINDVYDLANLPRLQTFLSQLDPKPSAVVLAGDFLSPSALSSIDGGRGMVATLRATGMTHVSLGNHEQDIRLDALHHRLEDLSKSTIVLNTNMRQRLQPAAQWMSTVTHPYSIIQSPCQRVQVALLGMMSDEPGIFRDNTFKGIPIGNVVDTYLETVQQIMGSSRVVDLCLPLTHASMQRDRELAQAMLQHSDLVQQSKGVIIGGHEHEPYDELVMAPPSQTTEGEGGTIRIVKSGMDGNAASLIDLYFECNPDEPSCPSKLVEVDYDLVEMKLYEPSVVVQTIVDKHQSVVKAL